MVDTDSSEELFSSVTSLPSLLTCHVNHVITKIMVERGRFDGLVQPSIVTEDGYTQRRACGWRLDIISHIYSNIIFVLLHLYYG